MRLTAVFTIMLVAAASAQVTMPPPAHHYELAVFRPAVSLTIPFTLTTLLPENVSCGHGRGDDPPDDIPNPTFFQWDDPADATKVCKVEAPTVVLGLPLGTNYRGGVRAVAANGNAGPWAYSMNTFRRAPRGVPCPNGQPGVMVKGEADLNGKPVQIQLCVNQ